MRPEVREKSIWSRVVGRTSLAAPLACVALCALTLLIALLEASPAAAQSAARNAEVREAMEKLKASKRYRFELPGAKPPEPGKKKSSFKLPNLFGWLGDWSLPNILPTSLSSEARFFIWFIIIALLCLAILPMITNMRLRSPPRRRQRKAGAVLDPMTPEEEFEHELPTSLEEALAQSQALAGWGDYAGAVHRLWLGLVNELRVRNIRNVSPAETAREILRSLRQRADLASSLRPLVASVEVSRFGGRALSDGDFQNSLEAFHRTAAIVKGAGIGAPRPQNNSTATSVPATGSATGQ